MKSKMEQLKVKGKNKLRKDSARHDKLIVSCSEFSYIKTIVYIITFTSIIAMVTVIKIDPVFTFIPIFHSSDCLQLMSDDQDLLQYWKLTTN